MVQPEITYGDEFIRELIPQPAEIKQKAPMYKSKFRHQVSCEQKSNRFLVKTMGPAKVDVPTPANFLKKREISDKKAIKDTQHIIREKRKPPVPMHDDQNDISACTERDFIRTNAIENITSVPRKPKAQYVDTNTGNRNDLNDSGLVPRYTLRSDFGEVPDYLNRRNHEVKAAQEKYDQYVAEVVRAGALEQVPDCNRDEILMGLKEKWEDLHHQYQGLSVVTDTAPKKNRKERMEAQMSQLERDIDMLERHKTIYVANH